MQDIIEVKRESGQESKSPKERKRSNSRAIVAILVAIAVVGSLGAAFYYKKKADDARKNPAAVQQEKNKAETDRVLTALKKVLLVSETDAPTVARVEDPEKLKSSNQDFYKDIQKSDYLIIFPKRAVIYRESINQIINIAPIINTADLKQKQSEQSTQPAASSNSTKTSSSTSNKTN